MTVEEEIRNNAKTTMEVRSLYEQWYRTFHEGTMGNQVAYAQARDSRKELEKPNWVPLDVVLGVYAKGLFSAEKPPLKTVEEKIHQDFEAFKDLPFFDKGLNFPEELINQLETKILNTVRKCDVFDGTFPKSSAEVSRNQKLTEFLGWLKSQREENYLTAPNKADNIPIGEPWTALHYAYTEAIQRVEALLGAEDFSFAKETSTKEKHEPCKHDKGVEVHRGEVYCFHCGEHLGKAIKKSELKAAPKTEKEKP